MKTADEFFSQEGLLSKEFIRYEARPQQLHMAQAVGYAIEHDKSALIEAGTGVGKSLGYLIPFLIRIEANRVVAGDPCSADSAETKDRPRRLVVSTGTMNLQRQLMDKELPMCQKLFPWLTYSMAVGTENYLCGCRLERALIQSVADPSLFDFDKELKIIDKWSRKTKTGLRMDLDHPVDSATWSMVNRQTDTCKCKEFTPETRCFYRRSRAQMSLANVIVVNHHLLMASLTLDDARVLPPYDYLVIDEIHQLEEVATACLGKEISTYKIKRYLDDARRVLKSAGTYRAGEINEALDRAEGGSTVLFDIIKAKLDQDRKEVMRVRTQMLPSEQVYDIELITGMRRASELLKEASEFAEDSQIKAELAALSSRAEDISATTNYWLTQANPNDVYQIVSEQHGRRIVAKQSPIDLAPCLRSCLWGMGIPVIGTSATISTTRSMKFMKAKLGAETAEELVLDSPFDYERNAMIYVANDMPEFVSKGQAQDYNSKISQRLVDLLSIVQGRAMILCTSNQSMKALGNSLKVLMPHLRFLVQGEEMERHQMVKELKADQKTVIVATSSFWHGVDIAGDALVMVIIVKLPFPNVGDPLFEARSERIDLAAASLGRSQKFMSGSFMTLSLPEMVIKLKQGFGRLIRTSTDYGCVAILDPRMVTKGYSRQIVDSLPRTHIVYDVQTVRSFYEKRPVGEVAATLADHAGTVDVEEGEEAPF